MPKTARYLIVIVSALLTLVLTLRWQCRRSAGDTAPVRWGSGVLAISEGAYYSDRISEIIHMWLTMGQRAKRDEEGRPREPYDTFLVFAPARRAWIEKGREKQRQSMEPHPQWTATLPNGAVVTFLDVCTHPSEGKQWWGPDGSPLGEARYFPLHSEERSVRNR